MQHFVLGLDKACIMADAGGNIKIIGAADRKSTKIFLRTGEWRYIYYTERGSCTSLVRLISHISAYL